MRKFKETKQDTKGSDYKQAFEALKEKEVQPETRKVKLVFKSCCGCGCSDEWILREVPYDSKLKDGDRIKEEELQDSDKWL